MKFYVAEEAETGRSVLAPTQEVAKEINKTFDTYEVPIDKAGLMAFAQDALDRIHELVGQINSLKHDASIAPVTIETAPEPAVNSAKEQLDFQQEVRERWDSLPAGLKADLTSMFMEDVRFFLKPKT